MTLETNDFQEERTSLAKERTRLAVERNRLANERTFLSWLRTGLAIIGGGFALTRLISFAHATHQDIAYIAGVILIFLGIIMCVLATLDYQKNSRQIEVKGWAGSRWATIIIVFILVSTALALVFITIEGFFVQFLS